MAERPIVLPPQQGDGCVAPAYPSDFTQAVERRWRRRVVEPIPAPRNNNAASNDNVTGGERCPACDGRRPIAPRASEYHTPGIICHHWRCNACGHEWDTTQTVRIFP